MNRSITVTGKGRILVAPDTIRLTITATDLYSNYETTVKKSTEDTNTLRETIRTAGLEGKDLKTKNFNIDTEYESYRDKNDNYKRRFKGYRYNHRMTIEFPNDNKVLGKVLYALSVCPVKTEFSIAHTIKDVESAKNKLLAKAVQDAKVKAIALADAAGVKLGEILNINYSWGELEIYTEPMSNLCLSKAMSVETDGAYDIDIEADDIDVTDTATIIWKIQ